MKNLLLIFTLCLISDRGASKEGYTGGGVLIKCKYNPEYKQNPKSFCKGSWPGCSDQIKTGAKNEWVTSGRFSLFDDTKSAEFWVMITELTGEDNGTYGCGVSRDEYMNIYTQVELDIKKGSFYSREVIAYAGTRSNIKCRYEDEYKNNSKSFLKIETNQSSIKLISTDKNSEWSHDGRFSIHDNRSAGFFSVFIREMITEDTGTYACAVAASDENEIYTLLNLNVTEVRVCLSGLLGLCAGLLVLLIGIIFITVILCKMQDPETVTPTYSDINEDHENVLRLQSVQKTDLPESVYQSLNPNTNQSDSLYLRV